MIWLKTGADKRRANSKEELRRLFQFSDQFHADELPTKAGIDKLDKLRFRDFLRDVYKRDLPDTEDERLRLLQNMNLATDTERQLLYVACTRARDCLLVTGVEPVSEFLQDLLE